MGQILEQQIFPWGGQICLADQQADLPHDAVSDAIIATPAAVIVKVADDPEDELTVQVYAGNDEKPNIAGLSEVFRGNIRLVESGMLIFSPTGEEVVLPEFQAGLHTLRIFHDQPPATRLVVIVDADA